MITSSATVSSMDYNDAAEKWLSSIIVKSIVEETLGLSIDDRIWQFNWVEYYPVWTLGDDPRSKTVKRIRVKLSSDTDFVDIKSDFLGLHELMDYDHLLELFDSVGAVRVSGIKADRSRWDIH